MPKLPIDDIANTEQDTELWSKEVYVGRQLRSYLPEAITANYNLFRVGPRTFYGYTKNKVFYGVKSKKNQQKTKKIQRIVIKMRQHVYFRDPTTGEGYSVDCDPNELCSDVKLKMKQKLIDTGIKPESVNWETDFWGRKLDDLQTIDSLKVGKWQAFVYRVTMETEVVKKQSQYEQQKQALNALYTATETTTDQKDQKDSKETKEKSLRVTVQVLLNLERHAPVDGRACLLRYLLCLSSLLILPFLLFLFVFCLLGNDTMRRLFNTLCRLDNSNGILVWSNSAAASTGDDCEISEIELVNLNLSLAPRKDADGEVRLYSLNHSDLFVASSIESSVCLSFLVASVICCVRSFFAFLAPSFLPSFHRLPS
jgi:hypothetical protein